MEEIGEHLAELSVIRKIAQEWVIKNDHGLTVKEQAEFDDWLNKNPRHRSVFLQEASFWDEFDRMAGLHMSLSTPVNADIFDDLNSNRISKWRGKLNWILTFPLVACLLLMVSFAVRYIGNDHEYDAEVVQEITIERVRQQLLEDGSKVMLNRGSVISTHYTADERLVKLLEGEANFEVMKDRSRPFIVEVSGVRVKAVGTEFNIKFEAGRVDVLVTEGIVTVNSSSTEVAYDHYEPTFLEVNQKAIIGIEDGEKTTTVETLPHSDVENETIWQPIVVDFEDAPLSEIVHEFNRRNPVQIVIHDPELQHFELSSLFWSDNVEGFISLLGVKFDIKARFEDPETVVLYRS